MSDVYDLPDWYGIVTAMRAEPDADHIRLGAADWLDEHGEADRARLIRLQCRLARLLMPFPGLVDEEWMLFESHAPWWFAFRADTARVYKDSAQADHRINEESGAQHDVGRGFLSALSLPAALWLTNGDRVYRREPVTRVVFTAGWPTAKTHQRPHRNEIDVELAGKVVTVKESDVYAGTAPGIDYTVRVDLRLMELAFGKRWPGVTFDGGRTFDTANSSGPG